MLTTSALFFLGIYYVLSITTRSLVIACCIAPVWKRVPLERVHYGVPRHLWAAPRRDAGHALEYLGGLLPGGVGAVLLVVEAGRGTLAGVTEVLGKVVVGRQTPGLRVAIDVVHDVAVVELLVLQLRIDILGACRHRGSSVV